jgi:hypothetical protein
MSYREDRIGAACAFFGGILLGLGTAMRPIPEDPSDAPVVFASYAAHRDWLPSHLLQFTGALLLGVFMLLLVRGLRGRFAVYRPFAIAGLIACVAAGTAMHMNEWFGLKESVDAWAAALPADKQAALEAALAVRDTDVWLTSLASVLFGATGTLFGVMIYADGRYPVWIGGVAVASGIGFVVSGMVAAVTGYTSTVLDIQMPASLFLLAWMTAVAALHWRRGDNVVGSSG